MAALPPLRSPSRLGALFHYPTDGSQNAAQPPSAPSFPRTPTDLARSGWAVLADRYAPAADKPRSIESTEVPMPSPKLTDAEAAHTVLLNHIGRATALRDLYRQAGLDPDALRPTADGRPVVLNQAQLEELTLVAAALQHAGTAAGKAFLAERVGDSKPAPWATWLSDDPITQVLWNTVARDARDPAAAPTARDQISARAAALISWDQGQRDAIAARRHAVGALLDDGLIVRQVLKGAASDLLLQSDSLNTAVEPGGRPTLLGLQFAAARLTTPEGLAWLGAAKEAQAAWEGATEVLTTTSAFTAPDRARDTDRTNRLAAAKVNLITATNALAAAAMPSAPADLPHLNRYELPPGHSIGTYLSGRLNATAPVTLRLEALAYGLRALVTDSPGLGTLINRIGDVLHRVTNLVTDVPPENWSGLLRQEVQPVTFATLRQARERMVSVSDVAAPAPAPRLG